MTEMVHFWDGTTHDRGELSDEQTEVLRPHVLGRHVHDLGAGDLWLTANLLDLGARHVTAVDHTLNQKPSEFLRRVQPFVTLISVYFHNYHPTEPIEVAFVSWPPYLLLAMPEPRIIEALPKLCAQAAVVAYLGSNFGAVCGNLEFWRHVGTREVLEHVPDPRNTLIVYGRQNARIPGQGLLPEEKAALYRQAIPQPLYGVTYG